MNPDPYGSNNGAFYNDPNLYGQQPQQQQTWFSDPNAGGFVDYSQQSANSFTQQPMGSVRPITSVGFEPPPAETLGGTLGSAKGMGAKGWTGPSYSRFGISTYEGEPPLLVELGIDFSHIGQKTQSALHPLRPIDPALMADGDLAGPFVFCFTLGLLLMLTGKLHFGYIFGFGVTGCIAIYMVLNLMTQKENGIELHVVFSVLGYSLLPINALAAVSIVLPIQGMLGWVLVPPCVGWCTITATRFFEATLAAREQRYLIAYPAFLFFACFALITVF